MLLLGRKQGEVLLISSDHSYHGRSLAFFGVALSLLAFAATSATASAHAFKPGAVFTETNTAPNYVLAFDRTAKGGLKLLGKSATGGNGQTSNNPPAGFPTVDSAGAVILSPNGKCVFAVNAASSTVSAFRLTRTGLKLVNHPSSHGDRPVSLTSTDRGGNKVLYVLNSDTNSASIHGFLIGPDCGLSNIRGSTRPTSTPKSIPAQIKFDVHGRVLAVSERLANDIDIFPVNRHGVAQAPVVTASPQPTPYGLDWNNRDILSVSNEDFPPPAIANSTVTTYTLEPNGHLVAHATAPSAGAACWNVFTNNGKFLLVTNPAGPLFGGNNVISFKVDHTGGLTAVDKQNTTYNALDDALTRDNKYLYVLSDMLLPTAGPHSAIDAFRVNAATGAFTPVGTTALTGNNTAGLAVL